MKDAKNREEWLARAVGLMENTFAEAGYPLPVVAVACGWPSTGGLARKKRTIGQCWSPEASSQKLTNVFISPYLDEVATPDGVLATLVHELVHAAVGVEKKHGSVFKKAMKALGLEGKATATYAGEKLIKDMEHWAKKLGDYPHGKLDQTKAPEKKQSTRMIKCECPDCGYVARTAKKWLDEVGAPHCPAHGEMKFELPEEDE